MRYLLRLIADPATDAWTKKYPLIAQRRGYLSDVVGDKIYVLGDCTSFTGDASSSIEIYDRVSDKWKSGGNTQTARLGFGSWIINGKIYVLRGNISPDPTYTACIYNEAGVISLK